MGKCEACKGLVQGALCIVCGDQSLLVQAKAEFNNDPYMDAERVLRGLLGKLGYQIQVCYNLADYPPDQNVYAKMLTLLESLLALRDELSSNDCY
jgi:hypothetical protein